MSPTLPASFPMHVKRVGRTGNSGAATGLKSLHAKDHAPNRHGTRAFPSGYPTGQPHLLRLSRTALDNRVRPQECLTARAFTQTYRTCTMPASEVLQVIRTFSFSALHRAQPAQTTAGRLFHPPGRPGSTPRPTRRVKRPGTMLVTVTPLRACPPRKPGLVTSRSHERRIRT